MAKTYGANTAPRGQLPIGQVDGSVQGGHVRVYREKTAPLVDYYRQRDLLADVDGVGTIEEVSERIDQALRSVPVRRTGLASTSPKATGSTA